MTETTEASHSFAKMGICPFRPKDIAKCSCFETRFDEN